MTTLFDSLKRKLSGDGEDPTVLAPQQATIADTLRAKTGKATSAGTPGASNLGEQAATTTATTQLAQGSLAGRLAGLSVQQAAEGQAQQAQTAANVEAANTRMQEQGLATQRQAATSQTTATEQGGVQAAQLGETMKVTALNAAADQELRKLAADKQLNVDNIWRDFKTSEQELQYRKDAAQLEQTGFVLAMRDKAYVDELNRIGTERDLTDKMNYKDEMERVVLGDEMDKLMSDMDFKRSFNANQREWDTKLAGMSYDAALQIAQAAIAQDSKNQMFSGAGEAAKAGIDYKLKNPSTSTSRGPSGQIDEQFQDDQAGPSSSVNSNGTLNGPSRSTDVNVNPGEVAS